MHILSHKSLFSYPRLGNLKLSKKIGFYNLETHFFYNKRNFNYYIKFHFFAMDPNMQPRPNNEPFLTSDQFLQQQQAGQTIQPLPQAYNQPQRDQFPQQLPLSDEQKQQYQVETQLPGVAMQGGIAYGSNDLYTPYQEQQPQMHPQMQPQPQYMMPPPQYMPPMGMQPMYLPQQPMMIQPMMPSMQPPNMNTEVRGTLPGQFWCLGCNKAHQSQTEARVGKGTWLTVIGIAVVTSWCCACFLAPIPLCFDCTKDTVHQCPQCRREVGRTNFLIN